MVLGILVFEFCGKFLPISLSSSRSGIGNRLGNVTWKKAKLYFMFGTHCFKADFLVLNNLASKVFNVYLLEKLLNFLINHFARSSDHFSEILKFGAFSELVDKVDCPRNIDSFQKGNVSTHAFVEINSENKTLSKNFSK